MGVDLSMQSVTKYLNGHSDVTGGVLSGGAALIGRLAKTRRLLGGILDPQPAYALGRGLKTLALRVARHNENGDGGGPGPRGPSGAGRRALSGAAVASRPRHRPARRCAASAA